MKKNLLIASLAIFAFINLGTLKAQAFSALDTPPLSWRTGSMGFSLSTEYFMSNANYDDVRGSFQKLSGDSSFSAFESKLKSRYGLSPNFALFGGAGFNYVRVVDPANEKTNSALTDAFIGANYLIWRRWLRAVAEIEAGYPITATDRTQPQPVMSDGVPYVRAGAFITKKLKWLRLGGYLGFHVPMEGLAKRLQYDLNGELPFARHFGFGLGLDGYEAVFEDELTYEARRATTDRANAGSQRYFAYDPALMQLRFWLSFRPDQEWTIKAGYSKTLDGLRTAEGQSLLLTLSFTPKSSSRRDLLSPAPSKRPMPSNEEAVKDFKPDEEKVDQSIFEEDFPESESNDEAP